MEDLQSEITLNQKVIDYGHILLLDNTIKII